MSDYFADITMVFSSIFAAALPYFTLRYAMLRRDAILYAAYYLRAYALEISLPPSPRYATPCLLLRHSATRHFAPYAAMLAAAAMLDFYYYALSRHAYFRARGECHYRARLCYAVDMP